MKMFVPMEDWDSGVAYRGEIPVPYRVGLPVWRELAAGDAATAQVEVENDPVTTAKAA